MQEGVAFFGRAGQAILKSLQRLRVDPMAVYGTNCLKFADGEEDDEARAVAAPRAAHRPAEARVVMGEPALAFVNALEFPLARRLEQRDGEIQRFTPTIERARRRPTSTTRSTRQPAKTAFWNAFKALGPWWAELPPY